MLQGQLIMVIMSVVIFIGLGIGFYFLKKQVGKSGMKLADWFNAQFITEFVGYTILALIILNVAEAVVAASIHPKGENQLNPASRFIMHFSIGMVAVLFQVNVAKSISDFTSDFSVRNGAKRGLTIVNGLLMIFCIIIAFGLPYANVLIIANGLDQLDHFRYFVQDYVLFWKEMELEFEELGLTVWNEADGVYEKYYDPIKELDYQMYSSIIMWGAHNALGLFDGVYALKKDLMKKSVTATNIAKQGIKDKARDLCRDPEKGINYLLKFAGVVGQDLEDFTKECLGIYNAISGPNKNTLSGRMAEHLEKVLTHYEEKNNSAYSGAVLATRKAALITEVTDFFKEDSSGGKGFSKML